MKPDDDASDLNCPHCRGPTRPVDIRRQLVECPACGRGFRRVLAFSNWLIPQEKKFGPYELIECIGMGAFGVVWKAYDSQLGRQVALKIPHAGPQVTPEFAQRLLREGRSAAQLRHPHIVSVFAVRQEGALPYLACELVEGESLADLILDPGHSLEYREIAYLVAKVADALHHAHQHGVVHRDIKPSNIMIRRSPNPDRRALQPVVLDFGLALRSGIETTMTVEGQRLGTPAYMSPEQAMGMAHGLDARSDIYSLGVVLYQLLTNNLPFTGRGEMLYFQVKYAHPILPRGHDKAIPRDLEAICLKAMAKELDHRYKSAAEMADDLRSYLTNSATSARPLTPWQKLVLWCKKPQRITYAGTSIVTVFLSLFLFATLGLAACLWSYFSGAGPDGFQPAEAIKFFLLHMTLAALALPVGVATCAHRLWALWTGLALSALLERS